MENMSPFDMGPGHKMSTLSEKNTSMTQLSMYDIINYHAVYSRLAVSVVLSLYIPTQSQWFALS